MTSLFILYINCSSIFDIISYHKRYDKKERKNVRKIEKILVVAAGVLVILETTVISGCRANISGTESDRMVEYTVICGDEIPEEFKSR